jgi:hypothetical protein
LICHEDFDCFAQSCFGRLGLGRFVRIEVGFELPR